MSNSFFTTLFRHKAWANHCMLEALRAVPDGAYRTEMAVILLTLDHTANVDQIFRARIAGEPHNFEGVVSRRVPTIDELSRQMGETDAWYVDYAGRVTQTELDEAIDFTFVDDGTKGRMTRGEMLAHVVTHGHSHRAALAKNLADISVKPPSDMVTTFVLHP